MRLYIAYTVSRSLLFITRPLSNSELALDVVLFKGLFTLQYESHGFFRNTKRLHSVSNTPVTNCSTGSLSNSRSTFAGTFVSRSSQLVVYKLLTKYFVAYLLLRSECVVNTYLFQFPNL